MNHQNSMLTVATDIYDDVIMPMATLVGCCALAALVSSHSPKMGLTYLKTKVC
jgi:hypothetical protein